MPIQYYFEESKLINNKGFIAKVNNIRTLGTEQLIEEMIGMGTGVTEIDISAVLLLLEQTIIKCLRRGDSVNINNLLRLSLSIKGVYPERTETMTVKPKQLKVGATISKNFVEKVREEVTLEKCKPKKQTPIIDSVIEQAASDNEKALTIGNMITIEGSDLRFNREMEDEGVFLENPVRKEFIKVNYTEEIDNLKLKFILKDIPWEAGETIQVRVRKRFRGGKIVEMSTIDSYLLLPPTPPAKPQVITSLNQLGKK